MGFDKFQKRQGGGFGKNKFGGGPRPMFQATCSQCGQSCEVPFKPTGERPIYCNNCFKNQAGPSARFAGKPQFGGQRPFDNKPKFSGQRPQFNGPPSLAGGGVSKAQFESVNQKLDKIIALLSNTKLEAATKTDAASVKKAKNMVKPEKPVARHAETQARQAKKTKARKK